MFRRAISAVAAAAVVLGGIVWGATAASAAISGQTLSPSVWEVGSSPEATVTYSTDAAVVNPSIVVEWDWTVAFSPTVDGNATLSGSTYTCPNTGITFTASGGWTAPGVVTCEYAQGGSGDPGTHRATLTGATAAIGTVTVVFPAGQVTAVATASGRATWTIGAGSTSLGQVRAGIPSSDGTFEPPPTIRLEINGNGGVCTPSFVEGEQGTWGTALTADKCTNGPRRLQGFSTSPTLAPGSVFVQPGGPVFFLTNNLLYAIWAAGPPSAAQDVVATPGRNSVQVTWKAPASDGGARILGYNVAAKSSKDTNFGGVCRTDADVYECVVPLKATDQSYTFRVVSFNQAGGTTSNDSAAVSPYDFGTITASRPNILLGLGGSRVEASGLAIGLAGKSVNAQYKVGNAKDWTTQANAATVNAQGKFSWSRKFAAGVNKQNVSVRFTYGTDLVSGTYVLSRGGEAGSLTAPRNIKVQNDVNRIVVTWDRPKFDGGEKITGYTMCASYRGSLCRNVSADGRGVFQGLPPGEYTITVEAKTATRTGPVAEAKKKVSPVEASVRITRRMGQEIEVRALATGFKAGAKFRLEAAVAVPGEPASAWRWEEVRSFAGNGNVNRFDSVDLGSSYEGETLAVRLVTPNGSAYSRLSRP